MEGVGARLGRSSNRYGPTTVFTGPVRKWKKKWVHVAASNSSNHHHQTASNGGGSSHLLLFKWTAETPSQSKENNVDSNNYDSNNGDLMNSDKDAFAAEEPPRRKLKYIPIAALEEQKDELSEQADDQAKPIEADKNAVEVTSKTDGLDEKPDINYVPMDENQSTENSPVERQDLNESTPSLSLGLEANDGDKEFDSKLDQVKDNQLERINSSSIGT